MSTQAAAAPSLPSAGSSANPAPQNGMDFTKFMSQLMSNPAQMQQFMKVMSAKMMQQQG